MSRKFLTVCCDNCKRVLCRHGEPHFPNQLQDAEQFVQSPQIVCNVENFNTVADADKWALDHGWGFSGLVFPDEQSGDEFMLSHGWLKIGDKTLCPECGSKDGQDWLNNRRGMRMNGFG